MFPAIAFNCFATALMTTLCPVYSNKTIAAKKMFYIANDVTWSIGIHKISPPLLELKQSPLSRQILMCI